MQVKKNMKSPDQILEKPNFDVSFTGRTKCRNSTFNRIFIKEDKRMLSSDLKVAVSPKCNEEANSSKFNRFHNRLKKLRSDDNSSITNNQYSPTKKRPKKWRSPEIESIKGHTLSSIMQTPSSFSKLSMMNKKRYNNTSKLKVNIADMAKPRTTTSKKSIRHVRSFNNGNIE